MISQCWLHIGTEKTGTTSIRAYLARNRMRLLSQGFIYPAVPGATNHYALTAFGVDDVRFETARRTLGVAGPRQPEPFRREFLAALEAEIDSSGASAVVLSSELLSSRLRAASEIARLKWLCDRIARNTKVIVYLRNQVDFLVSRYTNFVGEGGTAEFEFVRTTSLTDYGRLLGRWGDGFGRENIVARIFEKTRLDGGDLLLDFATVIGLDHGQLAAVPRSNESLDSESQAFLRALNRRLPLSVATRIAPYRGHIMRVLQRRQGGTKFVIPRALAAKIEEAFRESNERVAAEYFQSGAEPLFSPPLLVGADDNPKMSINGIGALRISAFLASGLVTKLMERRRERRQLLAGSPPR